MCIFCIYIYSSGSEVLQSSKRECKSHKICFEILENCSPSGSASDLYFRKTILCIIYVLDCFKSTE